ncbi:hypothetical protein [Cylindrospermum sp. FACHB-282]|uniref:hypothetical protein n=1 Tax=Cylindrospermum sp. FACHB-282 TaxID=2692794 RepID=UPI001683D17C|nr:hypothetical protein [Cylindrospermum sp. FACHB-282]MBD2384874.1 hypothetical protein [Cylindrospermum sp. FACHB-282]
MRQFRFWIIGLISFFAVLGGTFGKRVIAVSLCGVLGANSPVCYLVADNRVNAAVPPETSVIAQGIDIFDNRNDGNNAPGNIDIFSNTNIETFTRTGNNQPTSSSTDTENAEPICTCWVSKEQPGGKIWDCRLWGKLNGWGWWWFYPHGGEPSLNPPEEVQNRQCQVTDGKKELEEQRLNIEQPPRRIKP